MALKNELTKLAIEMKENDPNILILQDVIPLYQESIWMNENYYECLFNLLWNFFYLENFPVKKEDALI